MSLMESYVQGKKIITIIEGFHNSAASHFKALVYTSSAR